MSGIVPILVVVILVGLVLWAIVSLLRAFLRGMRPYRKTPFVPIVDPNPPAPVVKTAGLKTIAVCVIAWAVLHWLVAAAWAGTGRFVALSPSSIITVCYFCFAGLVSAAGGLMLLDGRAYGRRVVAMGHFLFGVAALFGASICIMLPGWEKAPQEYRDVGVYLAGILVAHLATDAILGTIAQHAGKAPAPAET